MKMLDCVDSDGEVRNPLRKSRKRRMMRLGPEGKHRPRRMTGSSSPEISGGELSSRSLSRFKPGKHYSEEKAIADKKKEE